MGKNNTMQNSIEAPPLLPLKGGAHKRNASWTCNRLHFGRYRNRLKLNNCPP